jgi:Predicted Fe-S-cluster oxidoreductase
MKNLVQITRLPRSVYYDSISKIKERMLPGLIEPQIPPERFSKKISESFLAPPGTQVPDCLTCGVCCAFALCVSVRLDDPTSAENYWEITLDDNEEIVIDRFLKRTDAKCDLLEGELGKSVACSIYETRPSACRAFEAGSDRCHAYRRMFGYEPPLTPEEIEKTETELNPQTHQEIITYVLITEKEVHYRTFLTRDGDSSETKSYILQISVFLGDDETPHIIHQYDPAEENWLEGDFLGHTLEEAKKLVESARNS